MKSEAVFPLENAAWPALLVDDSGRIRKLSDGARKLFGLSNDHALLSGTIWAQENATSAENFLANWRQNPVWSARVKLRTKDGAISNFDVYICAFERDEQSFILLQSFPGTTAGGGRGSGGTTFIKKSDTSVEVAVAHKQKLDCALQLTRSVALDFNNALTSILGHTSHLLARTEATNPARASLAEIEKAAEKAAEIAHDLAAFSRQEKDARSQQAGNINELIRRTSDVFADRTNIVWELQLEPRLYTTTFDEAKMQQAFLKVLENSVQAMTGQGRITIQTSNHDFAEAHKDANIRLQPGNYVCVDIRDTGAGISASNLARVFEPFFTTKNNPAHRGLGLAWVYGIVTNHGGSVAVSSEPGKGTSVRIYLPAQKKIARERAVAPANLNGKETILIVDDEEVLLTMGEMILSSYGYNVLTANNGARAIELFQQKRGSVDLVITDLVMPQMSGREVIEKLRALDPNVKVICASGFVRGRDQRDDDDYLQKPFTAQDLVGKVRHALGG